MHQEEDTTPAGCGATAENATRSGFLSDAERNAALAQHNNWLIAYLTDERALAERLATVREAIRVAALVSVRIQLGIEGKLDPDALYTLDCVCRDRLNNGIAHYPVAFAQTERATICGRF